MWSAQIGEKTLKMHIKSYRNRNFDLMVHQKDFSEMKAVYESDSADSISSSEAVDNLVRIRDTQGSVTINSLKILQPGQEIVMSRFAIEKNIKFKMDGAPIEDLELIGVQAEHMAFNFLLKSLLELNKKSEHQLRSLILDRPTGMSSV